MESVTLMDAITSKIELKKDQVKLAILSLYKLSTRAAVKDLPSKK